MDTDMTDAGYDIDIDVGAGLSAPAQQPTQAIEQPTAPKESNDMPAAYYENLDTQPQKAWPEILNLQGVNDFDPNDPLYYIMEHCGADPRAKQLRWVSDSSVNLEFYNPADAAAALLLLTHEEVGNANSLSLQDSRRAKTYSKMPDSVLRVREANDGDQKPKGAANRSNYYQRNPDVRGNREREPRKRQPPQRDFLDYGEEDQGSRGPRDRRRRGSGDESMGEDSGVERRRNNTRRNDRDTRGRGGRMRDDRGRDGRNTGRIKDDRDTGRLGADVDSYRPGTRSPRESHFGRLRGRSASPTSDDGDGRFGFAEDNSNVRTRYRSRSRSRNNARRRREPSSERWTHDRANYGTSGGRWQKDAALSFDSSPMGNHRRSDAMDSTAKGGSLLARMTKDGRPVLPQTRSLADRITRDDDDDRSYGRLKHDDSEPAFNDFSEPKPRRNLVDRISRDTEINIRGRGQDGINIRGTANDGSAGGINIRGVASGA